VNPFTASSPFVGRNDRRFPADCPEMVRSLASQ